MCALEAVPSQAHRSRRKEQPTRIPAGCQRKALMQKRTLRLTRPSMHSKLPINASSVRRGNVLISNFRGSACRRGH